jgi:hypothetical protein
LEASALGGQIALQLDAFSCFVLGGVAGDVALLHQFLEVGLPGLGHGQRGLQLGDGLQHGGYFSLAVLVFGVELGEFGADVLPFGLQLGLDLGWQLRWQGRAFGAVFRNPIGPFGRQDGRG